jgi:hypothetical protein
MTFVCRGSPLFLSPRARFFRTFRVTYDIVILEYLKLVTLDDCLGVQPYQAVGVPQQQTVSILYSLFVLLTSIAVSLDL